MSSQRGNKERQPLTLVSGLPLFIQRDASLSLGACHLDSTNKYCFVLISYNQPCYESINQSLTKVPVPAPSPVPPNPSCRPYRVVSSTRAFAIVGVVRQTGRDPLRAPSHISPQGPPPTTSNFESSHSSGQLSTCSSREPHAST